MTVYIEAPADWGARQMLITRLERELGYDTAVVGAGDRWVIVILG